MATGGATARQRDAFGERRQRLLRSRTQSLPSPAMLAPPVRPANTRKSCSVGTQFGVEALRATYAATAGIQPSVDENDLITSGWQIAAAAGGDPPLPARDTASISTRRLVRFEWIGNSAATFNSPSRQVFLPARRLSPAAEHHLWAVAASRASSFQMARL